MQTTAASSWWTRGFTLIELLVVVAIIGILAAIAIPQFAAYRQRGYDARAIHDLGNAVTAEESYFATNFTYVAIQADPGPAARYFPVPGFVVSATVGLDMRVLGSEHFSGTAFSERGSRTYSFDSETDTIVSD